MKTFRKIDENTWVENDGGDGGDYTMAIFGLFLLGGIIWVGKWIYGKILIAIDWCSQTIDAIGNWFESIF